MEPAEQADQTVAASMRPGGKRREQIKTSGAGNGETALQLQ